MIRLSWSQPEDLLPHELVASAAEGKDIEDVRQRWLSAGGSELPPVNGASDQPGTAELRELARALLAELDSIPAAADLARREPTEWPELEQTLNGQSARGEESVTLSRLHGAWVGRAAGCLLGKPVEKIPRQGIRELLTAADRWPLAQYFSARGVPADVLARWPWNRRSAGTSLLENINGMPEDDDLNFPLIALSVVETVGPEFSSDDIASAWLEMLPGARVFTAERVAYRNLLAGLTPPETAVTGNPFRDWIGAQIRTDLYGWINPGDPRAAAEMAWRDATVSHTRNGVYGAMAVAGMCAMAVVGASLDVVLDAGLAQVPPHSRYADAFRWGIELAESSTETQECLDRIAARYQDQHWVHVLGNACLVAFSLARSGGDFATAITTVVAGGRDTDSNGATVGSICGAMQGLSGLPDQWVEPLKDRLASSVPGFDGSSFAALAERTLRLAEQAAGRWAA